MSEGGTVRLVREMIQEVIWEYEQEFDPDEGLELRPEIVRRLQAASQQQPRRGTPVEQVERDLGLTDE
jgi:hypothetical protein